MGRRPRDTRFSLAGDQRMRVEPELVSIGGNRNPAAADWDVHGSSLLAYGAGDSIALWKPDGEDYVQQILHGHTDAVNAVKFFPTGLPDVCILLSGAADRSLRAWRKTADLGVRFQLVTTASEHQGPVTRIATTPGSDLIATGSSDGTVKIWNLDHSSDFSSVDLVLLQSLTLTPRHFPLALALTRLDDSAYILAVAGTRNTIQIFLSHDSQFQHAATLTGHEGWVRALDFSRETEDEPSDLLLASASQDKYIRLWRVHGGDELPAKSSALSDPALGVLGRSLSNKAHRVASSASKYSITFEALLLGHEDWIYTSSWRRRQGKLQLLTTSEDNSLAIWEADSTSGVWICVTRLGEISAQKGSTSATGSAGGFWIGLWAPDADSVVSLGRTGSWRRWTYAAADDTWMQTIGITGHTQEVKGICWSMNGEYLLSTGSDQTTRLFAQWTRGEKRSWHEMSRPQIHGYDLNCIDTISDTQFITGADEKLLRVFDEPKGVAQILHRLCAIESTVGAALPDAANIPVLGLSNKAIQAVEDDEATAAPQDEREAVDPASIVRKSTLDLSEPPSEDHLARHLLWPETEKLYGHGYEISAVAVSNDGGRVATACRASSIDHAVIRLYDTKEWLEIKPPLKAHSLTVTALQFSPDDRYLLSVGRDRQWVVWQQDADDRDIYAQRHANAKGHSRMILGGSWAPLAQPTFLTAGRDKTVKIWQIDDEIVHLKSTVNATSAVTAVACSKTGLGSNLLFALGTEAGQLCLGKASKDELNSVHLTTVSDDDAPAKTVNQIAWRPGRQETELQMAVASDDGAVRVYSILA